MENKDLKALEKKIREILFIDSQEIGEPNSQIKKILRTKVEEKAGSPPLMDKTVYFFKSIFNFQVKLYQVGIAAMLITMVLIWQQKESPKQQQVSTLKSSSVKDNAFLVTNYTVSM